MSTYQIPVKILVMIVLILLLSGCNGSIAAVDETLTVTKILTTSNDVEVAQPRLVEVGNCNGFPDKRIVECTAGTETNVIFTVGGSVGGDIKLVSVSLDPSVSEGFSFSRSNTESLALDPPPDGSVYEYLVTTTYHILAGEALVKSSDGDQKVIEYRYQASCSLSKSIPEIKSCQDSLLGNGPSELNVVSSSNEMIDSKSVPMRFISEGDFLMGGNEYKDEQPSHTVYLNSYYIDKFLVTNDSYKKCVDADMCLPPRLSNSFSHPNYFGNSEFNDYPVINIDWYMARSFCEWRDARLPTEAEWEKAARGTNGRIYPWGNDIDCNKANYFNGDVFCVGDVSLVGTHVDGASIYGVYDMAGNVWEWINSLYKSYPYSSVDGRESPDDVGNRVLRGGPWDGEKDLLRSSNRVSNEPAYYSYNVGFRCAKDIP